MNHRRNIRGIAMPMSALILVVLLITAAPMVKGQSGDEWIDRTFGTGGRVTDIAGRLNGMVVQDDGKIVAVGANGSNFTVVRFNQDGSFDTTFGTNGRVNTNIGSVANAVCVANAVALQTDSKIVVAGKSNDDFALARYNKDGSLDNTFGTGGIVTTKTDLPNKFDHNREAYAVAIQNDGKIVIAGVDVGQGALLRYNTNGSLDTSFGYGGEVTVNESVDARALAIQADGNIVAVGHTSQNVNDSRAEFAVARYNQNGHLDSIFASNRIPVNEYLFQGEANAVAIQADGKIVVVGMVKGGVTGTLGFNSFALARLLPNGKLDTSFSGDGKQITNFGYTDVSAQAVVIQADGKIVVAGSEDWGVVLARYNQNGDLDSSFSGDGKESTLFLDIKDLRATIAVQADGKIIVGAACIREAYCPRSPFKSALERDTTTTYCITDNNNPGRFIGFSADGSFSTANTGPGNTGLGLVGKGTIVSALNQHTFSATMVNGGETYDAKALASTLLGTPSTGSVVSVGRRIDLYSILDSKFNDRVCRVLPIQ